MKKLDGEALRQRLSAHLPAGGELLAWGWGVMGIRNVFVGASSRSLVIESVRLSLATDSLEVIDFSRIDALSAGAGDSSMPGWSKLNIESAITEAVTTHLRIWIDGGRSRHYLFRPMPFIPGNSRAGIELGKVISAARPDLPERPATAGAGDGHGRASWIRWALSGSAGLGLLFLVLSRGVIGVAAGGAMTGFLLGALASLVWRLVRVGLTGRD
jgi:hypothetical protein